MKEDTEINTVNSGDLTPAGPEAITFPPYFGPPLAPLFQSLNGGTRHVTVNSLDGSTVKGLVRDVSTDGTTVTIVNGDNCYVFDVAAVVMVKMARPESVQS